MLVKDLMSKPAATCRRETNLGAAVEILWQQNCGFLPVVDAEEKVVGVITDRDICIALGYSGDVIQARNRAVEAKNGVKIAFRVPREGAQFSIDMLGIPKDAPHPDNALKFIDYILRPEVIAAISDAVSYPNPNLAATPLVNADIRDDPGIYPPPEVRKLFYIDLPAPRDYERARTRAWNRVKAGS